MFRLMEGLVEEALVEAIGEIHDRVGLNLVPEGHWMSLYGEGDKLLARVPSTNDPMDDVDKLRTFWFQVARNISNEAWD